MSSNHKYTDELLIDYVEGLLTVEQRHRVESILEQDEFARSMVDGIRLWFEKNGPDREALEAWLNEEMPAQMGDSTKISEAKVVPIKKYIFWAAAAVILLALVPVWFAVQSPDYNELMAQYSAQIYEYPHAVRDSAEESKEAFIKYDAGEYSEAAGLFDEMSRDNPNDELATFMLGMSLFNAQKYSASATTLFMLTTGESRFSQQARWYYALASLNAGNLNEGIKALEAVADRGAYRFEEAELLLSEIESEDIGTP